VQAGRGGSPELRALAATRDSGAASLSDGEPVAVPIEDSLDLHAFAPRDVASVVGEYVTAAAARGYREVRLIHGRGIGVQREIVRSALGRHPLVESFADAVPEAGGWGATIAQLRAERAPAELGRNAL
jgi:dsDNA-specific endonuclease/ATPase MutS2